jgi:hypothetical protein
MYLSSIVSHGCHKINEITLQGFEGEMENGRNIRPS